MLIKVKSITHTGLVPTEVDVEINVANRGMPGFDIIGLPNKAVEESKDRVRTAINNSGIQFPARKITVNLAPGDVPKEGSFYDLPIAFGILSSVLDIKIPKDSLFFGELSLDGSLRHTKGSLLMALFAKEKGYKNIFVPNLSANEASILSEINVYGVSSLKSLIAHFQNDETISTFTYKDTKENIEDAEFDMSEIIGQKYVKRAIEIASAGFHNILMVGPPGSGKTMIARALPGILPRLNKQESLEVTKLYSVSGHMPPEGSLIKTRPFRSPHHTISRVGLIGGGTRPKPGEISLAHNGVLFLDEFNEFPRSVLEALRQPIEDGRVTISRSREQADYPARFMLVASANPCPCGYLTHSTKTCNCTPREIERYKKRVSGPILDRIDIHVDVPAVDIEKLSSKVRSQEGSSERIRKKVDRARKIQEERFLKSKINLNSHMRNTHINKFCSLSGKSKSLLMNASQKMNFSARSYFKIVRVARTIADLDGSNDISFDHIAEALQYRPKSYSEFN